MKKFPTKMFIYFKFVRNSTHFKKTKMEEGEPISKRPKMASEKVSFSKYGVQVVVMGP
jgi:hypothetical protein